MKLRELILSEAKKGSKLAKAIAGVLAGATVMGLPVGCKKVENKVVCTENKLQKEAKELTKKAPLRFADPKLIEKVFKETIKQGVNPYLVMALISRESSWRPNVKGPSLGGGHYAYGLFQLHSRYHPVGELKDIDKQIKYGVKNWKKNMANHKGDVKKALEYYNTGRYDTKVGKTFANEVLAIKNQIIK